MSKDNVNIKESLKKLLIYCKPFMKPMIIAIIFSIMGAVCSIIGPNKLKDLTNTIFKGIVTGINLDKVQKIGLFLAIIYLLSFIFTYFEGFIMAKTTNTFSNKLRNEISKKINKLPLKYFDKNSYGNLLSIIINDVDTIGQSLNNSVSTLFNSVTLLGGVLIMMFVTSAPLAITAILSTLLGFLIMIVILTRSQKYFLLQQKELGELNGHIEEIYTNHNIVKVYDGISSSNEEFDKINEKLYQHSRKSAFLSGLMPSVMSFIGNFSYVCICVMGSFLYVNGKTDIGTIVAFMLYTRLFTTPLVNLAQVATHLQQTAAASERVFNFLEEKELPNEDDKTLYLDKTKVKGEVSFNNVTFGYEDDKTIIKDFTAFIKPGSKVAIVGPTGAGKTTMVNLLMKFYDIKNGDIKIDGISTKDLTRENIHDLFVMVLQDTWLFNGSIKDNVIYNQTDKTLEDVKKVCKIVGLDHYINTLPASYETVLEDADSISAGEKQLLTIARGMLKDAPLLILDEATSSVDTRTEVLVQEAMDKLTKGKTSFIIAHRLSTIKNADVILVMDHGNIVEQGTHEELIKKNGFYAELYNSQFEEA